MTQLFTTIAEDPTPMGVRDAAMLAALYGTGMRPAGLAGLKVDDYNPHTVTFRIRKTAERYGLSKSKVHRIVSAAA
jgi:site-specific recombinase XerD